MSSLAPPNGTAAPRQWTDADFAFLNEQLGGPVEVPFFGPDHPMVLLDFSGIDSLILQHKIGNPLLEASSRVAELAQDRARLAAQLAAQEAARLEAGDDDDEDDADAADDDEAAPPAPGAPEPAPAAVDGWEQNRRLADFHDLIGQAVWLAPPWQPLDDVIANGRKPGHISVLSLTMAQRNNLVDVLYTGVAALDSFRGEPVGPPAPLPGDGLREESGGLPDPASPEPSEVLVRSGDLAPGARDRPGKAARR